MESAVREMERLRKKIESEKFALIIMWAVIIVVFISFISINAFVAVILIPLGIIGYRNIRNNNSKNKYIIQTICTERIFEPLLETAYEDVTFTEDEGFGRQKARNMGIFEIGSNYYTKNYIKAKYKDIVFEHAYIETYDEHSSFKWSTSDDGQCDYEDWEYSVDYEIKYFKGRVLAFRVNTGCEGEIRLCTHRFKRKDVINLDSRYDKIELEDKEFENVFQIYASNSYIAKQFLTPSMKRALLELAIRYKGMGISIKSNVIYVAYNTRVELMSLDMKKEFSYYDVTTSVKQTIDNLVEPIEILGLL